MIRLPGVHARPTICFFNDDGTLDTKTVLRPILISNWTPLDENGVPNGSDGPNNIASGAAFTYS